MITVKEFSKKINIAYTINELLKITKDQYGHNNFSSFFK